MPIAGCVGRIGYADSPRQKENTMQKFTPAFKVGFVVIIGLIMTIVMVFKFTTNWGQDEGVQHFYAYFNDATGLALKSQVRVAGIQVGEVESIALENNRAKVSFSVRKDIPLFAGVSKDGMLRHSATASKQLSGILGDYIIVLTAGFEGEQLPDGADIPLVLQDSGLQSILANSEAIMGDIKEITSSLAAALNGEGEDSQIAQLLRNLNKTLENIRDMTDVNAEKINAMMTHLEKLTEETAKLMSAGNSEVPRLLDELHDAIADMRVLINSTNANVDKLFTSTDGPMQQLNNSLASLDRSLSNIEELTNRINKGEGSVGRLLNDDTIADEAQGLLEDTRALIASGTKTVDSANDLLKPISDLAVDISLRGDYLVNANAFKVDFGVKLQPSEDKYYLIDLIMDPNGSTSTKSIMTYSSETGPVYETVTTNDDSFKFSAQFAKRWRWFVGRFGIIESTGGLGGDVLLFNDDLQFKLDLFAFNENEYPRLRGYGLLYFSLFMPWEWAKTFYLSAGFDDPFNTDEFDYFFGLGFRFSDNDVKSILSIIPTP